MLIKTQKQNKTEKCLQEGFPSLPPSTAVVLSLWVLVLWDCTTDILHIRYLQFMTVEK